jgi:hypothetical protein
MESILEHIRPPEEPLDGHLARLFHRNRALQRSYYRHKETGKEFTEIAGSFSWPSRLPGFVVVVGVERTDTDSPPFHCLDEMQSLNALELLGFTCRLQQKYSSGNRPTLFQTYVWGDYDRGMSVLQAANKDLAKLKQPSLIMSLPIGSELQNCFEVWVNHALTRMLMPDGSGKKRLVIGDCEALRNALQNYQHEDSHRRREENFPSLVALGSCVHSLLSIEPWLIPAPQERLRPTIDTWEKYASEEQDIMLRWLYSEAGELEDDDEL